MRAYFAGILSLEEPQRAVSPTGDYATLLSTAVNTLSITSDILDADGFTLMMWIHPNSYIADLFTTTDDTCFLRMRSSTLRFTAPNTNSTSNVIVSNSNPPLNEWSMITLTGSVANGLKLYINDVEDATNSMLYNNNVIGKTWEICAELDGSQACFRSWDRELDASQVSAHYAWDETDPLTIGAVAHSAMTDPQKVGLLYCSELVQDNPYDGSEYSDLSGNGVLSINNGITLTGEEIQFYTNVNDLPSGSPVIYPSTYRTHKQYAGLAIDMSVSAVSTSLVFSSTGASYGGMYALVQVTKASIDGNKLSVNWGTNYSFTISQMQLYDGALEGDSALFANGALPNTGILLTSSSGNVTETKTAVVPDLSAYNDIVTIVLFCGDDWSDPVAFTVNSLQLLSQADALITEYDITSNVAQTGTDGDSKFGTLGQVV